MCHMRDYARVAVLGLVLATAGCGEDLGDSGNSAPEADIAASQASGNAPLQVSFDASRSVDTDGYLTAFAWDFGDGAGATGLTATHTFNTPAPGAGSFGPGADIGTDTLDSTSAAFGDVDGDGNSDLVIGGLTVNRLFPGDGAGGFSAGADISSDTNNTRAIALEDVDNDGDRDIVAGNSAAVNRLYLNDGSGSFTGSDIAPLDRHDTLAVVFGDVDGDNDPDLIAGNYTLDRNRLYLNDGSGNFGTGSDITTDELNTTSIAAGDVDGDGDLDIVAGNAARWRNDIDADDQIDPQAANRLYLNDGAGNFTGSDIAPSDQHDTMAVTLEDVDGDGDLDLVAGNDGAADRLYLNDGAGGFGAGSDVLGELRATRAVTFGDIDADGDPDLVTGNHFRQANQVFLNDGSGGFSAGGDVTRDAHNTNDVLIPDLDGDGTGDIIIAINDGVGTTGGGDVNRLYTNGGGYTVQLTVTDDGGATDTASRFIVVGP